MSTPSDRHGVPDSDHPVDAQPGSTVAGSQTPGEPAEAEYHLPIEGFQGTPEEIDRQWFEKCYKGRGDTMLQLTWRAVIMGSVLGGVLSITNVYIGLKAGWSFGVAITACILSYAIWTTLYKLRIARTPMTILENNCMQTASSAAGASTGGTLISAFAAYILLNNHTLPLWQLFAWVFLLAILGVTMAVPMKRQMINAEQLRFPSGVAAAETLTALHSTGGRAMQSAKALGLAGLLAMLSKFWLEGLGLIKGLGALQLSVFVEKLNLATFGKALMSKTVMISWEPMFLAAGAITGMRVCVSMLIGSILCWMIFLPIALDHDAVSLTIQEPIPALPEGVDFTAAQLDKWMKFAPVGDRRNLEWKGIMMPQQRDTLLALSADPYYLSAVQRLYVRSQFRAAAPLAALPAGVAFNGDLKGVIRFDAQRGLVADEVLSVGQYEQLKSLSHDAAYLAAVDEVYRKSNVESFEPLWSSADLAALPPKFRIPNDLAPLFGYDRDAKSLLWRGPLSTTQRDQLLALSQDAAYQQAVQTLQSNSTRRALPAALPADLAPVVRFDAERSALLATGAVPKDMQKRLKELSKDAGYQRTAGALIASAGKGRAEPNFKDLVSVALWAGTACMVTSGLLSFALQWRSAVRAFRNLGKMFAVSSSAKTDPLQEEMDAIETPGSWFIGGQLFALVGLAWLTHATFDMPYWQSVVAVLLSFALALVACRVTGETDTTPIGAMGKISQLTFGALAPGNMNVNLMAANITAGAAGSAAALMTDLKSGYMLGAHPRKQFLAQFSGIFVGTVVTVLCFSLMVPDASVLGTAQFPAPAAQTWKAVAEALGRGLASLEPIKIWLIVIGGLAGILLPALSLMFPKQAKYIPSAAGIGLAWVFQWYYGVLFFLGAVIGYIVEKKWPKLAEDYTFPVASGVIAGEALMGAGLIFAEHGREILGKLFGM